MKMPLYQLRATFQQPAPDSHWQLSNGRAWNAAGKILMSFLSLAPGLPASGRQTGMCRAVGDNVAGAGRGR